MTVNKRKKNSRQRGGHTHGWGSKKKHRGSGNRGGKGMAGTGKRADQLKPSIWGERYFGKLGFKKKGIVRDINPINIIFLEENYENMLNDKQASKEGDIIIIDLNNIGYNKLLRKGKVTRKFKITTDYASAAAVEKISNAGGEVIVTKQINKDKTRKE